MSLTADVQQIDRRVKAVLRTAQQDELSREEAGILKQLKLHCNEARLDVRGYEYAETLAEQRKAAAAGRRNLTKLEKGIVQLHAVFGPADTAELGALIDSLRSQLL
jgi:hypothetical protein